MDKWKIVYFFSWLVSLIINRLKNSKNGKYNRILIIRLDDIGDMMTSLPAIEYLSKKFRSAEITMWCIPVTGQLLRHIPHIHKIVYSKKELSGRYDLIVDLRGNFETALYALIHQPYYFLDRGTVRFRNKFLLSQHPHEIKVNFQILKPLIGEVNEKPELKIYFSNENKIIANFFLQQNNIKKFIVLHPFSLKKLKEWNMEKFAELSEKLKEQFDFDTIFIGSKKEEERILEIQKRIPFKTFAFAGYDLLDLAALCSKASLFVGNDSGPMHIADVLNIPIVGLFGPGEPHLFSPSGKKATFIHHKLECNPCDQIHCKYPGHPCMHRIEVNEVINKIDLLMKTGN